MDSVTFMNLYDETLSEARDIVKAKNVDYGATDDVLSNFKRTAGCVGVSPVEGVLIRIEDKLGRILNFSKKQKFEIKDESVKDTVRDVINYILLMQGLILERDKEIPAPGYMKEVFPECMK